MSDRSTFDPSAELLARLAAPLAEIATRFPGSGAGRQPVHTVYGGAHLFRADTAPRLGELARRALDDFAPDAAALGEALTLDDVRLAGTVRARVARKLASEPIEDFRLDFEDGYGHRPDDEEDGHAASAAAEMARGLVAGTLPPFCGIRIKSLARELAPRALRTLDLFVGALLEGTGGRLPPGFVVTLPKIVHREQVAVLAAALAALEQRHGLDEGALALELMVETPQSIFAPDGSVALPRLVAAAGGRCVAAHFGTYDYTAALGITAEQQRMSHPACDFAKSVMQVALAGSGLWLSDGATNVLPVPIHRAAEGAPLGETERAANRRAVHAAWRLHARDVRHSLASGFFQGWDLHPAQLVTRYGALYAFFLPGLDAAGERLRHFVAQAAQATRVGEVFDDAATGQGLLNHFLRALACGAIDESEALARTGLTPAELATRSFPRILESRRARG
jgi:citrate lyase beta subunit